MSSLAAARADNFYYPPEWTPKQGNLNKFHGQHALRERARKIDQGILIIRFEMPYNIWCGGCNSMIAKGVRFNAEKKQVGNYYSTKIWSFSMKSACCKHEIVIQTDPKNCEYVIISGAQKKTEDYDIEDAETLILPPDEERGKLADPFYRLEHGEKDLQKKKETEPVLVRLQRVSDSRHSDDYALNKALRAQLRASHCGYDNLSLVPIHEHHHPLCCVWIKDFDKEMEKLKGSYSSCRLNPSAFHFLVPYLNPLSKYSHNNVFIDFPICQNQKKRVAEEEVASRKRGLGVRLLPASEEDAAVAASVKFSSKFERNRKEKRALIKAASIFPGSSGPSTSNAKRMELESKRRKIKAAAASSLLVGGFKPSSWSQSAVSSGRQRKV